MSVCSADLSDALAEGEHMQYFLVYRKQSSLEGRAVGLHAHARMRQVCNSAALHLVIGLSDVAMCYICVKKRGTPV